VRRRTRALVLALAVMLVAAFPVAGWADHDTRETTPNIIPRGEALQASGPGAFENIHSDIAFWGDRAYQGNFNGFRIVDISDPDAPTQVFDYGDCNGGQGDIVVWEDLLIRTWDAPAPGTTNCGGAPVPAGFEGLHFFDISDELNPVLIHEVEITDDTAATGGPGGGPVPGTATVFPNPTPPPTNITVNTGCGSHTATLVPDEANGRLLVYNSGSNSRCLGIDIIEVPLADPTTATWLRRERMGRQCHDTGVILGDVLRAACAGGNGFSVASMDPADGGSLTNPIHLYSHPVQDVTIGHSAAFTWDGEHVIFGHEPGGGVAAACQEDDLDTQRMFRSYDTDTGAFQGRWLLPRAQGPTENCTLHNYNFIPTTEGSDLLVAGHYQAGTWVTDFTDVSNGTALDATTVGFSDPDPIDPNNLVLSGAWSTYWYNGFMYETHITKGLFVFEFDDPRTDGAIEFDFLNPQTQMETIGANIDSASRTNLKHSNKPHRFSGRVKSDDDRCVAGRDVVVRKVRPGRDRVVASDTTNGRGQWSDRHDRGGAGRYYAVVRRDTVQDGIDTINCLRGRSGTKRFGR